MNRNLHIVCLDAPSPPDYGGAIDMYYKIKSLSEAGWKVILHYFNYRKGRSAAGLEAYCSSVYAYDRKVFRRSLPLLVPHIISSRVNRELIERLNADEDPILLEGLHCAGLIPYLQSPQRTVLRMHNNEAAYYLQLSKEENNLARTAYLYWEGLLLQRYLKQLPRETKLACLSSTDMAAFKDEYHFKHTSFIPCFIPWQEINGQEGRGNFCLYHGNLSISENEAAAVWLIEKVFSDTETRLVIAGKGISERIRKLAADRSRVELIADPSMEQIKALIKEAQVNVLPSMNTTGVKLKLLHALFEGRYCISNYNGVKGSGAEQLVAVAEDPQEMMHKINGMMTCDFSLDEKKNRQSLLAVYDNSLNAQRLSALY